MFKTILFTSLFALSAAAFVGCSDDSNSNPSSSGFNPGATPDGGNPGNNPDGGNNGDGACSNPPGCFCGTPTTQKEWLNRCTKPGVAALPVNLSVKPATTADIH